MDVDVLIIGSGQAGVPLATRLASAGKSVMIVERSRWGGTCINYGCTPTKTMVASARAAHVARHGARLGVHSDGVRVDFAAVVTRKDEVVRAWREGVQRRLGRAGERLHVVAGAARFAGERTIEVNGERHRGGIVVLDVGTRPHRPPLPRLATLPQLDNHTVMELRALPEHLVVLGGGYIGCEFAQMFRRFGARVTLVDRHAQLLSREDPEVSAALAQVFTGEGIELRLSVDVTALDAAELDGSHVLVALGRRPNTDDLGCDAAGIRLDERGYIIADDHYETSAKGVYAVGDVLGGPQFTHTAWDDHRLLYDFLTGRAARSRHQRIFPSTVFTDPQLAHVGQSERELTAAGRRFERATMPFGDVARAFETDERAGIMKILLDPDSERILGVTILGAQAGELLHILIPLMQAGVSARAIVDAEFVHPTFAEGVQSLVLRLPRYALH
jgi:pyruvate/2-oxoglutarate dehydrogenase complex dihydrolipoamide dehydrogenase (E3) component